MAPAPPANSSGTGPGAARIFTPPANGTSTAEAGTAGVPFAPDR